VSKRRRVLVAEALECLGGAGYVEESIHAAVISGSAAELDLEGSGNVIALDVMRAITRSRSRCWRVGRNWTGADMGRAANAGVDGAMDIRGW